LIINDSCAQYEALAESRDNAHYVLCLYITGTAPRSTKAIVNIRKICEEHLRGRYELQIVDIALHPSMAKSEQIIAAPTLIKKLPLPLRRFVGDMSNTERLLLGLDLQTTPSEQVPRGTNS
jgi:circadian clock protein KaiB